LNTLHFWQRKIGPWEKGADFRIQHRIRHRIQPVKSQVVVESFFDFRAWPGCPHLSPAAPKAPLLVQVPAERDQGKRHTTDALAHGVPDA
jgi:hypothetical protein